MKMVPTAELYLHAELMAIFKKWSTGANRKERMVEEARAGRRPVYQNLLPDLEPFQRPEPLLAVYPGSLKQDSRQPQPCPSLPLRFTSGTDVNRAVGGNHVFLLPPSLRGGADSPIPTPYSQAEGSRNKLLLQNGDFQVTQRSDTASSVLIQRGRTRPHGSSGALGEGLRNGKRRC